MKECLMLRRLPLGLETVLHPREREEHELFHKLKARRIVLLHSPSGARKSSLVQAALRPRLADDRFDAWPTVRLNLEPSGLGQSFGQGQPPCRLEPRRTTDDGRRVLTASGETARIWNVNTGQFIHKLEGHTSSVKHAAWSHDGRSVLTASADNTARIWAVGGTHHLQGRIRAEIRDPSRRCLPANFRQSTLGELPEEAKRQFAACEACVPRFFARLEGVPRGAVEPYAEAWREYRACLDQRLDAGP